MTPLAYRQECRKLYRGCSRYVRVSFSMRALFSSNRRLSTKASAPCNLIGSYSQSIFERIERISSGLYRAPQRTTFSAHNRRGATDSVPGLSKLRSIRLAATCGSAARCAERLRLSVGRVSRTTSSAQAGRLSHPACAEGEEGCSMGRKARGFPHSRRQSRAQRSNSWRIWTAPTPYCRYW